MKQIAELKAHGIAHLVEAARLGHHGIPQDILDRYAEVEQIAADHADSHGRIADKTIDRHADDLTQQMLAAKAWGAATALLIDHVQPGMDAFITELARDLKTARRYANEPAVTLDMLSEPKEVREAIVRLHSAFPRYGYLRRSWEILRAGTATRDPLGLTSPLAEIANLPDLIPDWQAAHHGRAPWPWHTTVFHVRMHWLLSHGARFWLPTAAEQEGAWRKYNPAAKVPAAA